MVDLRKPLLDTIVRPDGQGALQAHPSAVGISEGPGGLSAYVVVIVAQDERELIQLTIAAIDTLPGIATSQPPHRLAESNMLRLADFVALGCGGEGRQEKEHCGSLSCLPVSHGV